MTYVTVAAASSASYSLRKSRASRTHSSGDGCSKQWGYKPYLVDGNAVAVSLWRFIKQGCPKGIASSPRTCCATRSSLGSRARFRTSSCCKHGGCQLCFVAASIVRLILRRDRSQSIMAQDPPYSLIDLGQRSVRITDKHYSPRVAARHEQLESDCAELGTQIYPFSNKRRIHLRYTEEIAVPTAKNKVS